MQKHLHKKKRRIPALSGIRGLLAAMLFGILLWTNGASGAAMSGTYTIGGTGNYTTFGKAVAALTTNGVSGAVVFNVSAGTYSEAVSIPGITGASATNTITFQGAGRGKTIISNSSTNLYFESGCSYITFNGIDLTNTSSNYALESYYSVHCTVSNCNISMSTSSGSYTILDEYTTNFTVSGCHISGGYEQVYIYSSGGSTTQANNAYINNRMVGFGYFA